MAKYQLPDYALIFIATVLFVLMLKELQRFLRPFTIAIMLTFLFMPVIRWSRKHKIPYGLSVAGILLGFFALLTLVGLLAGGEGVRFINSITQQENASVLHTITTFSIGKLHLSHILNEEEFSNQLTTLIKIVVAGSSQLFSELFIVLLFLVFLLPSHEHFIKNIAQLLGKEKGQRLRKSILEIEQSISTYLTIKTIISLLTALATGAVVSLFKMKLIVAIILITFVLNFIPNIGSTIAVLIILTIYILQGGTGWNILLLALILIIIQNFFGNFLEPKVTGKKLKMSPIIILLSLFFWSWVWGLPGMILSVPIAFSIKIAIEAMKGKSLKAHFHLRHATPSLQPGKRKQKS